MRLGRSRKVLVWRSCAGSTHDGYRLGHPSRTSASTAACEMARVSGSSVGERCPAQPTARTPMARTPLFSLLQRAARISRAAARTPVPLDEFLDRGRELRFDAGRRRLLQGAGAGLVLAGCQAMPPIARPSDDAVVIVGAGIAGLTAAWRLRQAGVPARVFEAQARIGGRMLSLRDHFADGQVVELGGELIDTGHVRIRALAAELGLELDDLLAGETLHDTWYFDGRKIGEREIVEAFVPVAAAIERAVATLGDGDLDHNDANPAFRALDALSITQSLDRNGVSG